MGESTSKQAPWKSRVIGQREMPVAAAIWAMVAPCFRRSMPMSAACLVPSRFRRGARFGLRIGSSVTGAACVSPSAPVVPPSARVRVHHGGHGTAS